jgi:hypothetical protein
MPTKRPFILDIRICWTVLLAFCCLALLPTNGNAALLQSRLADGSAISERAARIEMVRTVLEKEVVSQRLADYGLSAAEISAKLPSLSDDQLHQLAGMSTDLAAGDGLGVLISVLVVVLLVVLIVTLMGKRIVIR